MLEIVTGGSVILESPVPQDVRDIQEVFGVPETRNIGVYRYLPSSYIWQIRTRRSRDAGYAADGRARTSGRSGLMFTTARSANTNGGLRRRGWTVNRSVRKRAKRWVFEALPERERLGASTAGGVGLMDSPSITTRVPLCYHGTEAHR